MYKIFYVMLFILFSSTTFANESVNLINNEDTTEECDFQDLEAKCGCHRKNKRKKSASFVRALLAAIGISTRPAELDVEMLLQPKNAIKLNEGENIVPFNEVLIAKNVKLNKGITGLFDSFTIKSFYSRPYIISVGINLVDLIDPKTFSISVFKIGDSEPIASIEPTCGNTAFLFARDILLAPNDTLRVILTTDSSSARLLTTDFEITPQ